MALHSLDRRPRAALALLMVVLFPAQLALVARHFGYFHDSMVYLSGARSLAEGTGYRFATHLGLPAIGTYPPLHSLYLSVWWRLAPHFPENVPWLLVGMVSLSCGAVAATFGLMRALGAPVALVFLFCLNQGLGMRWMENLAWCMSDQAMMAILLSVAWWWVRRPDLPAGPTALLLTGCALAVATLWRTAAAGAVLGVGIAMGLQSLRTRRWSSPFLVAGPPAVAYLLWARMAQAGVTYGAAYHYMLQETGGGFRNYLRFVWPQLYELVTGRPVFDNLLIAASRLPTYFASRSHLASVGAAVVVAAAAWAFYLCAIRGITRGVSRSEKAVLAGAAAYLLVVLLSPNSLPGEGSPFVGRYCAPVVPILAALAWRGWSSGRSPQTAFRVLPWVALGLVLALPANAKLSLSARRFWNGFYDLEDFKGFSQWVGANLDKDAVIAADWSLPLVHFTSWSGRSVVQERFHPGRSTYSPVDQPTMRPTHVLVSPSGWEQFSPPATFQLVHTSDKGVFLLYRVPSSALSPPPP